MDEESPQTTSTRDEPAGETVASHGSGPLSQLDEALTSLAQLAARSIAGADGVGITVVQQGRVVALAASNPFVLAVDAVQYRIQEGPCISAVGTATTMISGSMDTAESRWPAFREGTASLGLGSVVSTPLAVADEVLGSMNVYAHAADAFDADAVSGVELFARPAALAVSHAFVLGSVGTALESLRALTDRRVVIDTATGVLMGTGSGSDLAGARAELDRLAEAAGTDRHTAAGRVLSDHDDAQR